MHRVTISRCLAFALVLASSHVAGAAQVGVWQFNNSLGNAVFGGTSMAVLGGWSASYASETIAGSPATVLSFPAFDDVQSLGMPNDAPFNGSGGVPNRNNWTVVMDVNFPTLEGFTGLWETDALGSGDGDYFINGAGGIGIGGNYAGFVAPDTWTRIAVAVDSTTAPGAYTLNGYIDGVLVGTATSGSAPGGRDAIKSFLHLFADDDNETNAGLINSLAYYGETLNDVAIGALGAATAAGIPSAVNQTGRWQFDNNLTNAIAGKAPVVAAGTWTPTYVSSTIAGSPATVLSFPKFDNTQALDMPNEATPDDLGPVTSTNIWSIVMDVKFPSLTSFTALWNTDDVGDDDGEYFIRDQEADGIGGIGIDGEYDGAFNADTWHRVAVTVSGAGNGAAYVLNGYIDGVLASTSDVSNAPNGREAIIEILHLFADNDFETAAGMINSLAFYDEVLTADAIAALGGASAAGIPIAPLADADFDDDGDVDGNDFLRWQRNVGLGAGATNAQGDADGNGAVNATDLTLWKGEFGSAVPAAGAVPEPATAALALLASMAMCSIRRTAGRA
jgi:hypothetical protein